jgi:Ca2+-binding EF-hand superfamily protein
MQVLRTALSENAVRVIDLFRDRDVNGDGAVSFKEVVMGVTLLGFPGDRAAAILFREWDSDGSGSLQVLAC